MAAALSPGTMPSSELWEGLAELDDLSVEALERSVTRSGRSKQPEPQPSISPARSPTIARREGRADGAGTSRGWMASGIALTPPEQDRQRQKPRRDAALLHALFPSEEDCSPPVFRPALQKLEHAGNVIAPPSSSPVQAAPDIKGKARQLDPPLRDGKPRITKDRRTLTQMFPGAPPPRKKRRSALLDRLDDLTSQQQDAENSLLLDGLDFETEELQLTPEPRAGPSKAPRPAPPAAAARRRASPPVDARKLQPPNRSMSEEELITWLAQYSKPSGRAKTLDEFTPREMEEYEPLLRIARGSTPDSLDDDDDGGGEAGPSKARGGGQGRGRGRGKGKTWVGQQQARELRDKLWVQSGVNKVPPPKPREEDAWTTGRGKPPAKAPGGGGGRGRGRGKRS